MSRHRRVLLPLLPALLLVLLLAACGGGGDGDDAEAKALLLQTFTGQKEVRSGRLDLRMNLDPRGMQGVTEGKDRTRGVRIFDVTDPRKPKLITNVQTCRGSHTHTIVDRKSVV